MSRDENAPWYRDGLAFTCTRCGSCCTGAPGFVWVDQEEAGQLAAFRGETVDEFGKRYLRKVGTRISLVERPNGDCVFWDRQQGCTVYDARPVQCRTWPFWPDNIATPEDWEHVVAVCPGSGQGQLFTVEQIEASAARVHQS